MRKILTFVLILNMLIPASKICAIPSKDGAEMTQKVAEVKCQKSSAIDILTAVITAGSTVVGFYILSQCISTLKPEFHKESTYIPNINIKLDPINVKIDQKIEGAENNAQEGPGWFYSTINTISGFISGNLNFIYNFFRGNDAAPPAE